MVGLCPVRVSKVNIPRLDDVNERYWKFSIEKQELEGLGYVCPRCGRMQMIKPPQDDIVPGMLAWE